MMEKKKVKRIIRRYYSDLRRFATAKKKKKTRVEYAQKRLFLSSVSLQFQFPETFFFLLLRRWAFFYFFYNVFSRFRFVRRL